MRSGRRSSTFSPFRNLHLARLGALAPSRHNTQPWKFSIARDTIRIYPDFDRRLPAIDPGDRSTCLSLGCVTENIVEAAGHYGLRADVEAFGDGADGTVLIRLAPSYRPRATGELMSVMALRQCSRHPFRGVISMGRLKKIARASRQPGVDFRLVTDRHDIAGIADVLRAPGHGKAPDPAVCEELAHWTRFSRREAESRRDGLLFTGMGYPSMPHCIGRRILAALVRTNRQNERSAFLVRSSAALAVFAPEKEDITHWFNVGRSFQRAVLTAASLRIRYAHLQLPYASPVDGGDLRSCFGFGDGQHLLAVRLGYSEIVPHSLRRPLSHLLTRMPDDVPWEATSHRCGNEGQVWHASR